MKPIIYILLFYLFGCGSAEKFRQGDLQFTKIINSDIKNMMIDTTYSFEISNISRAIGGIRVVLINPPYREFPNILIYKWSNNSWQRTREGLTIGIEDFKSEYTDLHTQGLAIDGVLDKDTLVQFNSKKTKDISDISDKNGFILIPYQKFYHQHSKGKSSYTIDKTSFLSIADKLLNFSIRNYPNTCVMFDLTKIIDFKFNFTNLFIIEAKTENKQFWKITFTGTDLYNNILLNKVIEANLEL